jgi:hypothetical protein
MQRRRLTVLWAVPLLLLGLAACGSSGDGSGGAAGDPASDTASADPQEEAVKWAQCMRENGVDVPDPEVDDEGRVQLRMRSNANIDEDKVDAAMKACEEFSPIGDSGRLADLQNDPEFQEAQLRFARCMRDHGVDVPDPSGDHGGLFRLEGQNQEKVEAALEACQPIMRDFLGDAGGEPS